MSAVNDVQNYRKLVLGRMNGFLGDSLATPWGLKKGAVGGGGPHVMGIYGRRPLSC